MPGATTHEGTPIADVNFQFTPEELSGVNAAVLQQLCPTHIQSPIVSNTKVPMASIPEDSDLVAGFTGTIKSTTVVAEDFNGSTESAHFSSLNHDTQRTAHRNTVANLADSSVNTKL